MLTNLTRVLELAEERQMAVGAFTVVTREDIQGTIRAADELGLPVILQASPFQLADAGLEELAAEMGLAASRAEVPVVVQLDHAKDFDVVCRCLRAGFSSVQVDGSLLPYQENAEFTRRVVEMAHAMGATVEGELGHVGGTEDDVTTLSSGLTEPGDAAAFVVDSGIDALAIAIGTAHGVYVSEPKIDFDRLTAIHSETSTPLVLHGGSTLSDAVFQKAIALGIRKINIGTELKMAHMGALRRFLDGNPKEKDPRKYLKDVREGVYRLALEKMRLFAGL